MDINNMITENIQLVKLIAEDGMVLTNGESYGKEVYLGVNDSVERWREIQESDIPRPTNSEEMGKRLADEVQAELDEAEAALKIIMEGE